jgi:hypothetical protein
MRSQACNEKTSNASLGDYTEHKLHKSDTDRQWLYVQGQQKHISQAINHAAIQTCISGGIDSNAFCITRHP